MAIREAQYAPKVPRTNVWLWNRYGQCPVAPGTASNHTPMPVEPRYRSGQHRRRKRLEVHFAIGVRVSIFLAIMAVCAPSRPQESKTTASLPVSGELRSDRIASLEVGLAGPPIVGADGAWWLLGRDGEVEHFRRDDSLLWSISVAATITGSAAADELGLLFVPTAKDLVYALQPNGQQLWRFRAPAGIVGHLSWVPGQGLVLVGRDRAVYWLNRRANLLLRTPIGSRVSAGPVAMGDKVVVGTDDGRLIALNRQGLRQNSEMGAAILAVVPSKVGVTALAGDRAFGIDREIHGVWSRTGVVGIGVTAALGQARREGLPVVLLDSGQVDWLSVDGNVIASMSGPQNMSEEPVRELAATEHCVWISYGSGVIRSVCIGRGTRLLELARAPLTQPVIDLKNSRVLVGSVVGNLWSLPLGSEP